MGAEDIAQSRTFIKPSVSERRTERKKEKGGKKIQDQIHACFVFCHP